MDEVRAKAAASAAVAEEEKPGGLPDTITLGTGVVLRLRPVPQSVIRRAANKIPRPEVPMASIPDKDRTEENPDDPDYQRAVEEWMGEQALASRKVILIMGTEPVTIPDGVEPPDGDKWCGPLLSLGMITEDELADPYMRYLAWLEVYAARTEREQMALMTLPLLMAGITEQEVMDAITSFRGRTGRGTDNGSGTPAGGEDGNHLPRAARRARARSRGKGSR